MTEEKVAVVVIFVATLAEFGDLGAASGGHGLGFTLLLRSNCRDHQRPEFHRGLDAKQVLTAADQGAIQRKAHVTGFDLLQNLVGGAGVLEFDLIFKVECRLRVPVRIQPQFLTDFSHDVELDLLVKSQVAGALLTDRQ